MRAQTDEIDGCDRVGSRAQAKVSDLDALVHVEPDHVETKRLGKVKTILDRLAAPEGEYVVVILEDAVPLFLGERQVGILGHGGSRRNDSEDRQSAPTNEGRQ